MSDRSDAASLRYLERLLRMAVTQRGPGPNPVARRVVVPLLGMAMTHGGDQLIAEFLSPQPGERAIYEVRGRNPGDGNQVVLSADLNAVTALRLIVRYGRDGMGGVNLVGRTVAGVERSAIHRTTDGVLEYLFPSLDAYSGPDAAMKAALRVWAETFRRWSVEFESPGAGDRGDGDRGAGVREAGVREAGDRADSVSGEPPTPPAGTPVVGDRPGLAGGLRDRPGAAGGLPVPAGGLPGQDRIPTAAEIADAIQSSLMQMTVDINLTEVETLIRRTIASSFSGLAAGELRVAPAPVPLVARGPDPDELAEVVGSLVVERIAPLLPAVDDTVPEQIASMVAYQVDAFLRANPYGSEVEATLEQLEPLLGRISTAQRQVLAGASSLVGFESRILSAVEQLSLQVQELRDQARTSTAAVQALTDQVATLSRRSDAAGERLATAVGREFDQFSDRFRHQLVQVETAAKRTVTDGALPDGVNRLSAKLARSEAQIERLLQRLNEVASPSLGKARE